MRIFSKDHVYRHPWSNVTLAFWRKYPNKFSEHVREVDSIEQSVDEATGEFVSRRVHSTSMKVPALFTSLGLSCNQFVIEQTRVNPKTKTMTVQSRNYTGSSFMVVEETCEYTPHPTNPQWTQYRQSAKIVSFMPMVWDKLENFAVSTYERNASLSLEVVEELCQLIHNGVDLSGSLFSEFQMNSRLCLLPQ